MSELETTVRELLVGAVDLHIHPTPSPFPRRIDIVDAADHAADAGFSAVVMKSHHHSTVTDVAAVRQRGLDGTGIEVLGGIALNSAVGGLNPHAVDLALKMGGRIVWFPTVASPRHIEHHREHPDLKFPKLDIALMPEAVVDVVGEDGRLRTEVYMILESIRDADAILASGHMAPDRITRVFEAAREVGVKRMLVNHPNFVIGASYDDARHWVSLGAKIEHSLCTYDERSTFHSWELETLVGWIEAIGAEHSTLGSDLGQANNPLPTESFQTILGRLLDRGMSERDLRLMVRDNPGELLGVGEPASARSQA